MFFLRVRAQPIPRRHASHAGTTPAHSASSCGHHVPLPALAVVRISVRVLRSTLGTVPEAVRPALHVHAPPPTRPWDTAPIGNAPRASAMQGRAAEALDRLIATLTEGRRGTLAGNPLRARMAEPGTQRCLVSGRCSPPKRRPSPCRCRSRLDWPASVRGGSDRRLTRTRVPSPRALRSARLHQAPAKTDAAQKDGALYGADPFGALADWRPRRSARSGARLDV